MNFFLEEQIKNLNLYNNPSIRPKARFSERPVAHAMSVL